MICILVQLNYLIKNGCSLTYAYTYPTWVFKHSPFGAAHETWNRSLFVVIKRTWASTPRPAPHLSVMISNLLTLNNPSVCTPHPPSPAFSFTHGYTEYCMEHLSNFKFIYNRRMYSHITVRKISPEARTTFSLVARS